MPPDFQESERLRWSGIGEVGTGRLVFQELEGDVEESLSEGRGPPRLARERRTCEMWAEKELSKPYHLLRSLLLPRLLITERPGSSDASSFSFPTLFRSARLSSSCQ